MRDKRLLLIILLALLTVLILTFGIKPGSGLLGRFGIGPPPDSAQ